MIQINELLYHVFFQNNFKDCHLLFSKNVMKTKLSAFMNFTYRLEIHDLIKNIIFGHFGKLKICLFSI